MRVGVDVRKLGDGGIGEYIRGNLTAVSRIEPDVEIVAFGDPARRALLPPAREWVEVRAPKYSITELVAVSTAARGRRLDLFHAPHYVLPFALPCPSVVTIHDVIHLLLPRTPVHPVYARWMIASACRRAARVIAVSETTARDLAKHVRISADRLRVIPNGVSDHFRRLPRVDVENGLRAFGISRPYILFVGNQLPHKNVPTLVRAWARLPEPRPDLVLCGSSVGNGAPLAAVVDEVNGGGRVRSLGPLAPETLVVVYNGAELVASASLYEGFCLPMVEAFACGTPFVAPNVGAVPEIAADAALLVSPDRVDTLRDGMYRVLTEKGLREELVERGLRRSGLFSWEAAARRTLAVYEEVRGSARD